MPIRSDGTAPYAPPAAVLEVIHGFRERGLSMPFTSEVLVRAGVTESLVPRTLVALELLDLIDADGNPTPQLVGIRKATTEEFKSRLAEVVKGAYAEVFAFTDPGKDDTTRISDAFRSFKPPGQRGRMVTLFLGLCEAAGLIPEGGARKQAAKGVGKKREGSARRPSTTAVSSGSTSRQALRQDSGIPPALTGLLHSLPPEGSGWTKVQREKFMTAFGHVLDFAIPVREKEPETDDEGDE